jgi:hypothetical protein
VLGVLVRNPNLRPGVQRQIVDSKSGDLLRDLALNPNLSSDVRAALPKCSDGGPCFLGDVGPGGGTIVLVADVQRSWGRYMEMAPARWGGSVLDPSAPLCASARAGDTRRLGISVGNELGIGELQSARIVEICGSDSAAGVAARYNGGGFGDWFLPAWFEWRTLLNKNPEGLPALDLQPDLYWSSTVFLSDADAGAVDLTADSQARRFVSRDPRDRLRVRPIRVFD